MPRLPPPVWIAAADCLCGGRAGRGSAARRARRIGVGLAASGARRILSASRRTTRRAGWRIGRRVADRLVTAAELADMLGMSPATIIDWAAAGKVPSFKIGHAVRFRESEVLDWLERDCRRGPCIRPREVLDSGHA